jgi:styrene-oxide isomerase
MQKLTAYGFIYIGWANTAFYWFGNASANRALSFGDNPVGPTSLAGVLGFGPALIGALLIVWLLVYAAVRALGGGEADSA